jgi:hypothetical protein
MKRAGNSRSFFLLAATAAAACSRTCADDTAAIWIAAIADLILCFHKFVFLVKQLFTLQNYSMHQT